MAIAHGKNGAVYRMTDAALVTVTFTKIAHTTNWSIDATGDPGEVRRHGDNWVSRLSGMSDWNVTVEALLDLSSNQTFISQRLIGTGNPTMRFALYVGSATIPRWDGVAVVNEISPSVAADGAETVTFVGVGNGTLNQVLS